MSDHKERGLRPGLRRLMRLPLHSETAARHDADAELAAYLESRIEHLVARGLSPDEARDEALRRLGGATQRDALQESAVAREHRMAFVERVGGALFDVRYALRGLARRPAFAFSMIATLALGIGAATGVFSIVNGVLLRALPYPEPDRLVRIYETSPRGSLLSVAIPTLDDWRRGGQSFEAIALYGPSTFDFSDASRAEKIQGATTSAALFNILGARPIIGRTFTAAEDAPGGPAVVVLGHRAWVRLFNGDSSIVGRTITLDRKPATVIGVMPPGFAYPVGAEIWAPIGADHEYNERAARHMSAIGRLKRDASIETGTQELLRQERVLAGIYPKIYQGRGIQLIPLDERIVGEVRPALLMLSGAVLLVLIVACANVANLLLGRAASRQREIALRTALGGTRGRIARQLFVESAMVFAVAGLLGIALAAALVGAVRGLGPEVLPRASEIQIDGAVLAFAIMASALTAGIFGLIPALEASKAAPGDALMDGGRGSTGGRRKGRLRAGLIVAEAAMAAMLLVGAGLLVRSLERLNRVDPGFPVANTLAFSVAVPSTHSQDAATTVAFFRSLRERIAAVPGVSGVGLASRLPLSGEDHSNGFRLESDPADQLQERSAQDRAVTPGWFKSLGIPVLAGREFTEGDGATAPAVVMVNRAFAEKFFPGVDPVGKRFTPTRAGNVPRVIVGVVTDTRQFGLDAPAEPEFYIPHAQDPWPWMHVAVRAEGNPLAVLPGVRQAVRSLDPQLAVGDVRTIASMAADAGARRRLIATVLSGFGVVAYLLAAIGLYGVIAFSVAEQTPAFGIRMALGAQRRDIARMVLTRGVGLAAIGVAIGLLAAAPLTSSLRGMLYEVNASDPVTYVLVALLLPLVAVLACIIPARRAAGIDPATAMRAEWISRASG